jgi:hypothetical protein
MRWVAALAAATGAALVAGVLAVAVPAGAATGLTATFKTDATWDGAYQGSYTLATDGANVDGWTVQFDLPAGASLANWWSAQVTTSGQHVTAKNLDWNRTVAKGASVSFGFLVNGSGTPLRCTVNGSSCSGGPVDVTPPHPPTNLHVTGTTSGSVSLAWTAGTDNIKVVGYDVLLGGGVAAHVTGTSATVDGLAPSTTYSFTVRARDAAGNVSGGNPAVSAKTGAGSGGGGGGSTLRVAPYIDMGAYPTPSLSAVAKASTLKSFTLAFIIGKGNQCTASWFGAEDPRKGWQLAEITKIRQAGGDVKISFGGANGMELAQACTDMTRLTAEYQAVVTAYRLKYIDFDIEGTAVADPASIDRRSKAIKKLQAANPGLKVSLTLPVLPSGLDANGLSVVKSAKANGLKIDIVNVMAMDYGSGFPGDYGTLAINAAKATHNQLKSVFGLTDVAAYRMVGVTPMLGENDDHRIFSIKAAGALVGAARTNHYGMLAFWEVTRDRNACHGELYKCTNVTQSPYQFSKIFAGYTG